MRLRRATSWNLLGLGTPVVLALFCVPILLSNLGRERFGLLSLTWTLLGTAALFDLGLGRALTVSVAQRLTLPGENGAYERVISGLAVLSVLGTVVGLLLASLSCKISLYVNRGAVPLHEVRATLMVAAPAIALVVASSGVACCLEAFRRFDISNIMRLMVGAGTVGGATVASYFTSSLPILAAVMAGSRMLSTATGFLLLQSSLSLHKPQRQKVRLDIIGFVRFGRWITAGNALNPLLSYADRFALTVLVAASSIASYVVPYDVLTRLLIVPGAVSSSLLPSFSASTSRDALRQTLFKGVGAIAALMFPILLILVIFAHWLLGLWISRDFADQGYRIAQILSIGVMSNSMATLPFLVLQAQGRARQIVLVQICEVPFYLGALYYAGTKFGVVGIASAWSIRMLLDAVLLWCLVRKVLAGELLTPSVT